MDIWEQATALHVQKRYDEAEPLYDQLLTQNHKNPGLMATMGTLYLQKKKYGLAIHLLESALAGGLDQCDVLSNLGLAYKFAGLPDKAMKCLERSVKKDPTGEALANYSAMFIESGQDDKCAAICKRAIDLSPEHPIAHWNLALTQLANGEWDKAWDEHEWGLVNSCMRIDRALGGVPVWDGSHGNTVLVYGEQGIGDEIMFASMLPDLMKTNKVIIECHKRLKTLFEQSFPGVTVYGTREERAPEWVANEKFDFRLSIGSLGKFYRRSADSFTGVPYMRAEPLEKGRKMRVGISWSGGGSKIGRVQKRSVPLSWWKTILGTRDVEFVSLQYTDCREELDLVNALGYDIKEMDEYVKADDYYQTARLVASCDLVISVCTSVIHLAGALGVPCWVLTPKNPAWRYQNEGRMPWYRSVRLYRQPDASQDSWLPVLQRVGLDLQDKVDSSRLIVVAA
jgi:Flp pilus assembly protein TadD